MPALRNDREFASAISGFALLCAVVLAAAACSDEPAATGAKAADAKSDAASDAVGAGGDVSATSDGAESDGAGASDVSKVDPKACPGGYGCACSADSDCSTGLCLEGVGPEGASACAIPCAGACPSGQRCRELAGNDGTLFVCVSSLLHLCDPCIKSKDCKSFGLSDSACLDYGDKGGFCGTSCQSDGDCGKGFRCTPATAIEGEKRLFCVREADAGEPFQKPGTCPCSSAAIADKLSTTCGASATVGGQKLRCTGTRACGDAGLSACSAVAPKAEACNAVDDDCDGQTDEETCDDLKVCTKDACGGAAGCSNTPLPLVDGKGAPCDADGSNCTPGDACDGATCKAGATLKCDDNNPCTLDGCDKISGCSQTPQQGKACDDGSACTGPDACQGATCKGGVVKSCDDKKACTIDVCDPKTGACSNALQVGMLCDDGKLCTWTDLCDAQGVCAGSAADCDDGLTCTVDSCSEDKGCTATKSPEGSGCDDGDACTGEGTCVGGKCLGGKAKTCPVDGPCFIASCLSASGACLQTQRKAGLACDDGNACTLDTLCDAAAACTGKALKCDDGEPCTADSCDKGKGCVFATSADGTGCDDGDSCTGPDTCVKGKCKPGAASCQCKADSDCVDDNPCTKATCDVGKGTCSFSLVSGTCDDGDACTIGDACGDQAGKAACLPGQATKCDDAEACTDDSCNPKSGCVFAKKTDGAVCTDGETCTSDDTCKDGKCAPGKDTCACAKDGDCDDGNSCTSNACDLGNSKCGAAVPLANGVTCSDADACTKGDICSDSACKAGGATDCDDKKACTIDSCDAKTGCAHAPAKDGEACTDGDACSTNDACSAGACVGKQPDATVSTWAGSLQGYTDAKGDLAAFKAPTGLVRAADGTIYIADLGDHRVRKIAADQTVTTLAGEGVPGQVDDKGTAARFHGPAALALDGADHLVVLDRSSHLVRKVALADAAVSTFAGSNTPGGFGQPPVGGFADGKGTAAKFSNPSGIANSGADFYIADAGNHRLRKLAADGTVSTLAGAGGAGSDDGPALDATFNQPHGVAVAADGTVYIADRTGRKIRRLKTGAVVTLCGSGAEGDDDGKGAAASFRAPWGLHIDGAGALLVADQGGHRIRRVLTDGTVSTYFGSTAGSVNGALASATLDGPTSLQSDGKGKLFIATQTGFKIRFVDDLAKTCALGN